MSKFPDQDPKLNEFLRQYPPLPSEAPPELEARVMANLPPQDRGFQTHWKWTIPAIAGSLLLTWIGYQNFQPRLQYGAAVGDLEAFVVDSWDETLEMEITAREW